MITYIVRLEHREDDEVEEIEVLTLAEAEELYNHYKNDDYFGWVEIEAYAYTPGKDKRKATIEHLEPEAGSDYPYRVHMWYSQDGGQNFYYTGFGRMCETREEAEKYINENLIKEGE